MAAKRICASKIGGCVPEKAASRLKTQVIGGDALQSAAAFYSPTDFSFSSSDPQIHPDIIIDLRRILLLLFSFITLSFLRISALPWNLCQNIWQFFPSFFHSDRSCLNRERCTCIWQLGNTVGSVSRPARLCLFKCNVESPFERKLWKPQWSLLEPNPCRNNMFFNKKKDAAIIGTFCSHKLIQGE